MSRRGIRHGDSFVMAEPAVAASRLEAHIRLRSTNSAHRNEIRASGIALAMSGSPSLVLPLVVGRASSVDQLTPYSMRPWPYTRVRASSRCPLLQASRWRPMPIQYVVHQELVKYSDRTLGALNSSAGAASIYCCRGREGHPVKGHQWVADRAWDLGTVCVIVGADHASPRTLHMSWISNFPISVDHIAVKLHRHGDASGEHKQSEHSSWGDIEDQIFDCGTAYLGTLDHLECCPCRQYWKSVIFS